MAVYTVYLQLEGNEPADVIALEVAQAEHWLRRAHPEMTFRVGTCVREDAAPAIPVDSSGSIDPAAWRAAILNAKGSAMAVNAPIHAS